MIHWSFRMVPGFDPSLAPGGKTSVTVILNTWEDSYWRDLATKDPAAYRDTKAGIANSILKILDSRFPGLSSAVEKTDVSTPHSVERHTHNAETILKSINVFP